MLRSSKRSLKKLRTDNRGLSIIELVIVIAIMAVLLGLIGVSVNMLIGTEAKQAAKKMDAQLNDIKTGAMTRAGEYLIVRYIKVTSGDERDMAKKGVDKSGFYAEKHISTITNNGDPNSPASNSPAPGSVKYEYLDEVEYTRIGSNKVTFTVEGNEILSDGSNGYKLEFDRRTGRILKSSLVDIAGSGLTATYTESSDVTLTEMDFKAGVRTYTIEFNATTGKHTIKK